jgi:hypothetical protein
MIINPYRDREALSLDAFSFKIDEINQLFEVLYLSDTGYESIELPRDEFDRLHYRFRILNRFTARLENFLSIRILGFGRDTSIQFIENPNEPSYKCENIDPPPNECVTITAESHAAATVKCSVIANKKNWFGAVAIIGRCKHD